MKTFIVGYDETEAAQRALERAAELAPLLGAKVVVTSVAPVLAHVARGGGAIDPVDTPEMREEQLERAKAVLSGRGVDVSTRLAVGAPAETIVELAEETNAAMIIVGTREPGVLERILGGSVSQAVSRRAHCDVLIVH